MFRERSNLTLKREQSMLADMGHGVQDAGISVAVPDAGSQEESFDSMMSDAESKYAGGDYEGALLTYSMALGMYPEKTEILDGLTKAQSALEEKLTNPEPRSNTSGQLRVSEGVASVPGAPIRGDTRLGATATPAQTQPGTQIGVFTPVRQQSLYDDPRSPPAPASRMASNLYPASPLLAPSPGFQDAASRASFMSMSLPPTSAMDALTPAPTMPMASPVPAMLMGESSVVSPPPGSRASKSRPQSSGRLSARPPSAIRTPVPRPITPAAVNDIMDARMFAITQLGKIDEDISQELWERCRDRCDRLIETIQKASKMELDTEEKETYLASIYNSLGMADFAMGNMDKALEDHNLAIHIAETYNLFDVKATADEAIGRIHMSLGREASTMWEETIKIDKEVRPKVVSPPPVPGNLTRTKTILASEDSPGMVDIAMPMAVRTLDESNDLQTLLQEAKAKTAYGDHEGALMLYSAAQTQYPDRPEVEQGLKAAEAALQKTMEGVMTSRASVDRKVRFTKGGWAQEDDIEEAAVYLDPEQEVQSLREYATEIQEEIEQDLEAGELESAQTACEEFLEKFGTLKDDVTLAEKFSFLATTHNQLGRALGAQGETDRALDEHTAALQIAERNGLDDIHFEALDLIARLYLAKGQVDKAIAKWKECLPVCLDQSEKSEIYHKIALAELTQDNYMQARINGDKAAMAAIKSGDMTCQFNAQVIIGMTLVKTGDRVSALEEYQKAMTLAVELDDEDKQEDIQNRITALEEGDLEQAAAPSMTAVATVLVVASPLPSPDGSTHTSRTSSRRQTPSASRTQSRVTSPIQSRRSSRAPSPSRADYRIEDETDMPLSPRGIDVETMKTPRGGVPSAGVMNDTLIMLQMYLILSMPDF